MIQMTVEEYAETLQDSPTPELDRRTVLSFAANLRNTLPNVAAQKCLYHFDTITLMLDQLTEDVLLWPLSSWISVPALPFPLRAPIVESFLPDCYEQALESLEKDVPFIPFTALFESSPQAGEFFFWLHSPVVLRMETYESWLFSLKSERRRRVRRVYEQYQKKPGEACRCFFGLPSPKLLDWAKEQIRLRFGQDRKEYEATLCQAVLWPAACGPRALWILCEDEKGNPLALASYTICKDRLRYQFLVKEESKELDNIGLLLFAEAVWFLHQISQFSKLDPTCKQSADECSFDQYKRMIVNRNEAMPTLCLFRNWKDPDPPMPPYWSNGVWNLKRQQEPYGEAL